MNVDHALSAGNRPNKAFFTSEAGEVYGMHRRAQDDSSTSTIATAERGGEETREISYWLVDSDLSFSTAAPTESISVPQHSVSERQMPIPDHQRAPTLPEKTEVSKLSPIHIDLYPPNGISEKENEENWMQYYILSPTIVTVKPSIKLKWLALLLMTCFALLSGMDGKKYCQKSHINDDYQEHQQCAALFMNKVFPAGAVTIFCSILALGEISRPGETSVHLIGLPAVVALVAWSYSLLQLMLFSHPIPRASSSSIGGWNFSTSSEYSGFSPTETASIKQQQEESLYFFQSPSLESSLYCINELGEIGANANLYHAAWISLFVSMALSHQYLYPLFLLSCCRSYLFWKEQRVTRRYFFRHRERIRSWLAVLISCLIVMSSSSLIWTSVLRDECTHSYAIVRQWEEMQNAMGDDDYDDNDDFLSDGRTVQDDDIAAKTKVSILAIHPRICPSTELGMIMGASGAFVALITIIIHSSSHKMSSDGIPLKPTVPLLKLETFLCIGVVLTFGYGSMFLTGSYQGGLAQNVGNLYYSTWVAFVVSVRILIGCVEELFSNGADNSDIPEGDTSSSDGEDSISDMEKNPTDYVKEIGQSVQRGQSPRKDSLSIKGDKNRRRIFSLQAVGRKMSYHELQDKARATTKNWSEDRKAAIKRWCGIALFSTICHGAAFDAVSGWSVSSCKSNGRVG